MRGNLLYRIQIICFTLFLSEQSAYIQIHAQTNYISTAIDTVFLNKDKELFSSSNQEIKEANTDTLYWIKDSSLFTGVIVYEVDLIGFQIIYQKIGQSLERTFCNYENGVALVCSTHTYTANFITVSHQFETRTIAIPGTEWVSSIKTFTPNDTLDDYNRIDYTEFGNVESIDFTTYKDGIECWEYIKFSAIGDTLSHHREIALSYTTRSYFYRDSVATILEFTHDELNALAGFKNENLLFVDSNNNILTEVDFIKLVNGNRYSSFSTYQLSPQDAWMTGLDFIISEDQFFPDKKNRLKKVIKKIMKHRTI